MASTTGRHPLKVYRDVVARAQELPLPHCEAKKQKRTFKRDPAVLAHCNNREVPTLHQPSAESGSGCNFVEGRAS